MRQRVGRYDRAARRAGELGDWDALERYAALLDRDVALLGEMATAAGSSATAAADRDQDEDASPPAPVSRAGEFTVAATLDTPDAALYEAFSSLHDDPAAQEQILDTLAWREELEHARDAEITAHQAAEEQRRAELAAAAVDQASDASPLTNPAARESRRLTPEQRCGEEYRAHIYLQYMDAETACRGHLLSREGQAADIDPLSLFSGPANRANKYASPELLEWWQQHGRITSAEWRYQWFGRDSDRKAARTARRESGTTLYHERAKVWEKTATTAGTARERKRAGAEAQMWGKLARQHDRQAQRKARA